MPRTLIAESGIADPSLTILVPNNLSLQEDLSAVVQSQLGDVGVSVTLEKADAVEMTSRYAAGGADGIAMPNPPQSTSLQTLARNFTNSRSYSGPTAEGVQPLLDQLYDPSLGDSERIGLLEDASALLTEQAVGLYICAVPTQFAYSDKVIGIENMGVSNFQGIFDSRYLGITE